MASQKMFPCVVSEHTGSKEGKHSLLQTTCNRFFLKPNKSTLCFRSCDTFLCFVLFPTYPISSPPPTNVHTHTKHILSFHILYVRSPVQTEWRASMRHAQAGKQEREFKGVQHEMLTELGGNPGLMAALQSLKTLSKVHSHTLLCFSTAIMCSTFACAKVFRVFSNFSSQKIKQVSDQLIENMGHFQDLF